MTETTYTDCVRNIKAAADARAMHTQDALKAVCEETIAHVFSIWKTDMDDATREEQRKYFQTAIFIQGGYDLPEVGNAREAALAM